MKNKRSKWPEAGSRQNRKTTLRVLRGGRNVGAAGPADASPADLWRDLGDVATDLVEKAGSVIQGLPASNKRSTTSRKKKAA